MYIHVCSTRDEIYTHPPQNPPQRNFSSLLQPSNHKTFPEPSLPKPLQISFTGMRWTWWLAGLSCMYVCMYVFNSYNHPSINQSTNQIHVIQNTKKPKTDVTKPIPSLPHTGKCARMYNDLSILKKKATTQSTSSYILSSSPRTSWIFLPFFAIRARFTSLFLRSLSIYNVSRTR